MQFVFGVCYNQSTGRNVKGQVFEWSKKDISNMISDACTPQIDPDIVMQTIEGKTVIVIHIAPGKFRPYYLKSSGKEASSYIRINGTSRPADPRMLQELELEGKKISYDSLQEIGMDYDEEAALRLCRTMKKIAVEACETEDEKASVKEMTIEKLEDFGLLCKVGAELYPTHSFMLLTDNRLRYAKIQCALFKGTTRDIFIDRKEFDGPIYGQIEDAYQFVLKHINLGAEVKGIFRRDVFELPVKAIREMIANAVVHRSYLDDSCIQVSVYDDRVEVDSPGMLYGGMDIETAKLGKSRCRNAAIAEAFHYMRIVETWGTGIPRIISKCKEYGLEAPLFEEFGDGLKVTIFRKVSNALEKVINEGEKVSNTSEKVSSDALKVSSENFDETDMFAIYKNILQENGITDIYIKNIYRVFESSGREGIFGQADVMRRLKCSKSKATNVMNAMKKAKVIEKVTGLGARKYKFKEYN